MRCWAGCRALFLNDRKRRHCRRLGLFCIGERAFCCWVALRIEIKWM
jgi:hypothetical protein